MNRNCGRAAGAVRRSDARPNAAADAFDIRAAASFEFLFVEARRVEQCLRIDVTEIAVTLEVIEHARIDTSALRLREPWIVFIFELLRIGRKRLHFFPLDFALVLRFLCIRIDREQKSKRHCGAQQCVRTDHGQPPLFPDLLMLSDATAARTVMRGTNLAIFLIPETQ